MIRAIGWAAKAILADFAHPIVARWGWAWITIVLAGLAGLVAVTDIIAAVGQAPTILRTAETVLARRFADIIPTLWQVDIATISGTVIELALMTETIPA